VGNTPQHHKRQPNSPARTTRHTRRGHTSPPTPASPRATNTTHEPTPSLGEAGASLKQPPTLQCVGGGGEHATTAQTTTPFTGSYNQKPSPRPYITADPRLPQSSQHHKRTNAITGGGGASLKHPPTLQCVGGGGEKVTTTASTTAQFTDSYNQTPSPRAHITTNPASPRATNTTHEPTPSLGEGGRPSNSPRPSNA